MQLKPLELKKMSKKKKETLEEYLDKWKHVAEDLRNGVPKGVVEKRHGVKFAKLSDRYKTSSKNIDNYIERFNIKKDGNKKGTH